MKGMFDFLEKAGLVTRDEPAAPAAPAIEINIEPMAPPAPAASSTAAPAASPVAALSAVAGTTATLDLDTIYAQAGIAPAQYPAERLLRLIDGLSAMDEATRLMAIKAMDAADESWTIADPLSDAATKIVALAAYGDDLKLRLQQVEAHTQTQLNSVLARQEMVVGDIRKQVSELEALAARELARAEQETAAQQASLQAARDQTTAELAAIAQASARLQSLASQFGTAPQPVQE
jgi:hypothetical protein